MIHPLIVLSAFSLLAGGAAQQQYNGTSELDISTCPIAYYGQVYDHLYVNFTSESVTVCFDGFYEPGTQADCFVGPLVEDETFDLDINSNDDVIFQDLSTLDSPFQCQVALSFPNNGNAFKLVLGSFGKKAAVYLYTDVQGSTVFDVEFNVYIVDVLNVTNTPDSQQQYSVIDISGCRSSGELFSPDSFVSSDPNTCTNVTCSPTAELVSTGCGNIESCHGEHICLRNTFYTCTLEGPTVVDFHDNVAYVEDRCAYDVLSDLKDPNVRIVAAFQERRRKDVSFVDSFVLEASGVQVYLKQDGSVQSDGKPIGSDELSQLVPGMQFSVDQNGHVFTFTMFNRTFTLFFDGTMAQLSFSVPTPEELTLQGLCGNSNVSLSELKASDLSVSGCEIQYSDSVDDSINCGQAEEFCNSLWQEPFSSCNGVVDPSPYITACSETLCHYPSVDGVGCEFLSAYVRACSLQEISIESDWSALAGCAVIPAFCQGRICNANEFCAERLNSGETSCFCRAVFASPYRESNALGDPTVCGPNSASLTLVGCLLEEQGVDYSTLHLYDDTCTGQRDEQTHMVTFAYDNINTCGTEVVSNDSKIIYTNAVTNLANYKDVITRSDQVFIDFTCLQAQPDVKTVSFKIKDSSVVVHVTSEVWNYTLTMNAYTDVRRTNLLNSDTEVLLDQRVWVELSSVELDDNLINMVTESCWATSDPSPDADLRHDLIVNGCPNPEDSTVAVGDNGSGTSNNFSFKMFRFTGQSGDIYLHCNVQLCVDNCVPACGARRRRSLRRQFKSQHSASISMAWIN